MRLSPAKCAGASLGYHPDRQCERRSRITHFGADLTSAYQPGRQMAEVISAPADFCCDASVTTGEVGGDSSSLPLKAFDASAEDTTPICTAIICAWRFLGIDA